MLKNNFYRSPQKQQSWPMTVALYKQQIESELYPQITK